MAGYLIHGKFFKKETYRARDGKIHWEVMPIDGDVDIVSHSTWKELKILCEHCGIPQDVWVEFPDNEEGIDISLEEINEKWQRFLLYVTHLEEKVSSQHILLARIISYIQHGEKMFFCP